MNSNPAVTIIIVIICLVSAVGALAQNTDEQRIPAHAQSGGPDEYAFILTVHSETTSNAPSQARCQTPRRACLQRSSR